MIPSPPLQRQSAVGDGLNEMQARERTTRGGGREGREGKGFNEILLLLLTILPLETLLCGIFIFLMGV